MTSYSRLNAMAGRDASTSFIDIGRPCRLTRHYFRYVEWEKYSEKKAKVHKILTSQNFPPNPEFQLGPISGTNPVLPGTHWKMWHTAIGGELTTVAEDSWATVLREKHPEMLHLLQFRA